MKNLLLALVPIPVAMVALVVLGLWSAERSIDLHLLDSAWILHVYSLILAIFSGWWLWESYRMERNPNSSKGNPYLVLLYPTGCTIPKSLLFCG